MFAFIRKLIFVKECRENQRSGVPVLSIRRRTSREQSSEQIAFSSPGGHGWPNWDDMRPMLLRSAGIVGVIGVVVAVISSDPFGLSAGREQGDALAVAPQGAEADAVSPAPTEAVASTEPAASAEPAVPEPAVSEVASVAPSAPIGAAASAVAAAAGTTVIRAQRPAPLATTAIPDHPGLTLTFRKPGEGAPPPAAAPSAPIVVAEVAPAEPLASARAAVPPTSGEAAASGAGGLWSESAVECPRGWLSSGGSDASDAGGAAPADCKPISELVADAPPEMEAALQDAATTEALKMAGFLPRVPEARPDPPPEPPVRKASVKRRSGWPDSSPPDCGSKHAFWHFVDKARSRKEWYCK